MSYGSHIYYIAFYLFSFVFLPYIKTELKAVNSSILIIETEQNTSTYNVKLNKVKLSNNRLKKIKGNDKLYIFKDHI